jgi:CheY-like chemotaxis protein
MGFSVLVIDDDLEIRETLQELLTIRKYPVHTEPGAAEALAWLRDARALPSLILLDRSLADMPGDDLRQLLAADPRFGAIPVVMMSASPGDGTHPELRKPFSTDELFAVLRRHKQRTRAVPE